MPKTPDATLRERAAALGLHGLLARWHSVEAEPWLVPLITAEETERCRRSLERRIGHAALGVFKPVADFDWAHPRKIDRDAVEALFDLDFLREHINVVFIGSGGVGKTMLAQNLAHRAILAGHTARFVSAADMLGDLAAQDGSANLRRRLRHYTAPSLLVLDEVGYMSYGQGYADLLFQVISQRRMPRIPGLLRDDPLLPLRPTIRPPDPHGLLRRRNHGIFAFALRYQSPTASGHVTAWIHPLALCPARRWFSVRAILCCTWSSRLRRSAATPDRLPRH